MPLWFCAVCGRKLKDLALSVGILLAFVCVGTLVFFVGHMASRINVDTVIELVSEDVRHAIRALTTTDTPQPVPLPEVWDGAVTVADTRRGYLQQFDGAGLADWSAGHGTSIRLLVRPGDYVCPGAPIGLIHPPADDAAEAIRNATALGPTRASSVDLEFAIRQLVEVAVRALSPGINDPHTAISVLDRLGAALCDLVPLRLPSGVFLRENRVVLVVPHIDYDGLTDTMFHMIRQNAAGSVAVPLRLLEVLTAVASVERDPQRLDTLQRHADLAAADAEHKVTNLGDLAEVRRRVAAFVATRQKGPGSSNRRSDA